MAVVNECRQRTGAEVSPGTNIDGRFSTDLSWAAPAGVIAVQDLDSRIALSCDSSRRLDGDARVVIDPTAGVIDRGIQRACCEISSCGDRNISASPDVPSVVIQNGERQRPAAVDGQTPAGVQRDIGASIEIAAGRIIDRDTQALRTCGQVSSDEV